MLETTVGGRYTIVRELGSGGFGQTFLAEDRHLPGNPLCVVKQLKPQSTDPVCLQTARRLFDTEAQVLYKLGSHDQIPRLLAHLEEDQEFYLVQEYVEGNDLKRELIAGQPWSEARVVAILQDLLQILVFVHQQDVIHRDIKPANIIRRHQDGRLVLIDFGAVKQVSTQVIDSDGHTSFTIAIGTPGYLPNEQLAGNPRFSSDLYAAGMLAIQMLTGLHPRQLPEDSTTSEIHWHDKAQVSPELANILDKLIRYDFRQRYQSAEEVLRDLQQVPKADVSITIPLQRDQSVSSNEPASTVRWQPSSEQPASQMATQAIAPLKPAPSKTNPKVLYIAGGCVAIAAAIGLAQLRPTQQPADSDVRQAETTPASSPAPDSSNVRQAETTPASSPTPDSQVALASALINQGNTFRELEKYPEAIAAYEQALAIQPNSPDALWGRCYALNMQQQYAEAQTSCQQAVTADPNLAEAWSSQGFALDAQQKYPEALAAYDKALQLKPEFAQAWSNRGATLIKLQRYEEAIAAFDRATKAQPNFPEVWNNRGAVLRKLQRYDEALGSYEKALELKPDYADAWNNKGVLLTDLRRYQEAIAAYDRAIQLQPNYQVALENRQRLLNQVGR